MLIVALFLCIDIRKQDAVFKINCIRVLGSAAAIFAGCLLFDLLQQWANIIMSVNIT